MLQAHGVFNSDGDDSFVGEDKRIEGMNGD